MTTINEVIAMKEERNTHFGTKYGWLIQEIENNLVSKSNGAERVRQQLSNFDYNARLFIAHQFVHLDEGQIAKELFDILELDDKKTFLDDEYVNELVDSSFFNRMQTPSDYKHIYNKEIMQNSYIRGTYDFYYDESEHSRRISKTTINAENYYDSFFTATVGWSTSYSEDMERRYQTFEHKYIERFSKGELKSTTISNRQLKYGFASINKDNEIFMNDFLNLFDDNVHIYFSVASKIEHIILQLFKDYSSNLFVNVEFMKYSIIKSIVRYRPEQIINGMYENSSELIRLLMDFFESRIEKNKENLTLKEQENRAYEEILLLLDDVNEKFTIDWEYKPAFIGFMKYVIELNIKDLTLILDQEGSSETLKAAHSVGFDSAYEIDSKESFGVRWADMFVGLITKLVKSLDADKRYTSFDDSINKKLLSEKWFNINETQLNLYKKMNYIIIELNKAWYKSYAGLYSDDLVMFIAFIQYMNHFESVAEMKETDVHLHAEYFNSKCCEALEERFKVLGSILPIEPIPNTEEDYFYGQRGQKIYFDDSKQPIIELINGKQIFDVLSVGFSRKRVPMVTIMDKEKATCFRLPKELYEWAFACVSYANKGERIFPSKVLFAKKDNKYYADIL